MGLSASPHSNTLCTGNNAQKGEPPKARADAGSRNPNTKKEPTGLIAYPATQGRAVSGCGSQRMLHALERRSHPADHGPSFAFLFPPLAAVSSAAIPVWVKLKIPRANAAADTTVDIPTGWDPNTKKEPTGLFFAACGRPCSFDSSYGLHETATTLDIPSCWDPRANQSPTGALVAVLRTAALFDSRAGQIKNALAQCAKAFL